ncbi:CIA30 family protein [Phycisphaera mikurensis]|uniref:NADH:ubiquinone oxidoreductase intermediate-associated protein 30 domain-containing protein n=1 Tax=Phycisphaera mikurensis (strain NBRC 102666 / KCTC 22515 / FYK2301M01) TaxID=1142394 RepID=I0IJ67_PHYMF|nr:CIA30 family protein [Phycisphaera mikurensis]MBB6443277.1 hypothetical protein [Phycisphaera mikurensis]BAM05305.1 hypothetical protein PSMK_31460 [Phycisphaera mikurensis NBRC 102666]
MKLLSAAGLFCVFACLCPDAAAGGSAAEDGVFVDFSDAAEAERWRVVNDGVMGGGSEGAVSFEGGVMTFAGEIVTDGGGFSSVRRALEPGVLAGAEAVTLRVRSDGRGYRVSFRDGTRVSWGGEVMHAASLDAESQEWTEATVRFDDLTASFHGEPADVEPFDPAAANQIGVILSDGVDGAFRLEVEWIRAER